MIIEYFANKGINPHFFYLFCFIMCIVLLIVVLAIAVSNLNDLIKGPLVLLIVFWLAIGVTGLISSIDEEKKSMPTTLKIEKRIELEPFKNIKECTYDNYLTVKDYSDITKLIYKKTTKYGEVLKTIEAGNNPLIYKKQVDQDKAELIIVKKVYANGNVQKYYPYEVYGQDKAEFFKLVIPKSCKG
ncbi:hypothetical protein AAGG74_17905 [Bacillus mexicanus]|uniref:hypothetical protein n=1 Tax=Bacillus mexicanus TaxID=2834415 RepID=UPI003D1EBE2F